MYWAPDSRSIFFSVKTTLKQVNPDSGSGRTVAELPVMPMLATWRSNSDVLLYSGPGELSEFHLEDGSLRKGPVIEGLRWPQLLPGGDRLIYGVYDRVAEQTHVVTTDYANRKPVTLMQPLSGLQTASATRRPSRETLTLPQCCNGRPAPPVSLPERSYHFSSEFSRA